MSYTQPKKMVGVVESVAFTNNGAGNQWTIIDGVRYATFWDVRKKDWKIGDGVRFVAQDCSLLHGMSRVPHASVLSKLKENETAYKGYLLVRDADGEFEIQEGDGSYIDGGFLSMDLCKTIIDGFDAEQEAS